MSFERHGQIANAIKMPVRLGSRGFNAFTNFMIPHVTLRSLRRRNLRICYAALIMRCLDHRIIAVLNATYLLELFAAAGVSPQRHFTSQPTTSARFRYVSLLLTVPFAVFSCQNACIDCVLRSSDSSDPIPTHGMSFITQPYCLSRGLRRPRTDVHYIAEGPGRCTEQDDANMRYAPALMPPMTLLQQV